MASSCMYCRLFVIYVIYLLVGGAIFMFVEYEEQISTKVEEEPKWTRLKEIIINEIQSPEVERELTDLGIWLTSFCAKLVEDVVQNVTFLGNYSHTVAIVEQQCPRIRTEELVSEYIYPWDFIDALYFSMTAVTTIGYGHISPSTTYGRVICMFYSLFGIPLTGMLLASTSGFYGNSLFRLFKLQLDLEKQQSDFYIVLASVVYAVIGFAVFIFLPALIFKAVEDWTYFESVYFAFITLTTIGFGDYVPAQNVEKGYNHYIYQLGVISWVLFGLGYWVMLVNFITRAIKSKHIYRTLAKRAVEVKQLIHQVNNDKDFHFLPQRSKATINLLLQVNEKINNALILNNEESNTRLDYRIPGVSLLLPYPYGSTPSPRLSISKDSASPNGTVNSAFHLDENEK